MAELTSVTNQLKSEYEELLSKYQADKTAYEDRVRQTKYAKDAFKVNTDPAYGWAAKIISYKDVEDRFKIIMQDSYQKMISAKNTYLEALQKENPQEYANIKAAESREAFAKKLPVIAGVVLLLIVLVIIAIKKGWFKKK